MADGRLWMLECDAPTCGSQLIVTTSMEGRVTSVHGMGVDQPTYRRRLVRGIRDVYRLARDRGWQVGERPGRLPPRILCPRHDSPHPTATHHMGAGS